MKTTAAKWILVSACAALIAATAQAAQRNPHDSRHPDPRGRVEYSRRQRSHPGYHGWPAPQPPAAKARIALVIDDMGEDVGFAKGLAALDVPVAFSIWPDSGNRDAVLKIARSHQREILIHLPMQPKGYPQVDPGRHALLIKMTAEQIQAATQRAIGLVHGAIGVNNHMGSAFTENGPAMRAALETMKQKGLFFLDSRTTAQTVGVQEAKKLGLRHYQRDVFLDNEQDVAAILKQLRQAEAVARKKG
ncbi:MAG: divergent polysaccharide deacetylase family protein, partial [Opitutae bacterium]|nr:divergent polysaccharide deacetylase family protein [Opitutae bacterium]